MPLFSRKPNAVIASAADISPGNTQRVMKAASVQQAWQSSAWKMFDKLAEIHYPASYIGTTLGRFMWPVGKMTGEGCAMEPTVMDAKDRDKLYMAAEEAMAAFEGPLGGPSALARLYGINMAIAADGYLVGEDESDATSWEFLSIEELHPRADGTFDRLSYGQSSFTQSNYRPAVVRRFWEAHPARTWLADSAMNSLIDDCERLAILNASMKTRIVSRLAQAGIVFVPSELQIHGATSAPTGDGNAVRDPFMTKFMGDIEKAIMNPGEASGVAPIGVRGPATAGEAIRFITMDRTIDAVEMQLRAELRQNIATGLNLPPEASQGLGDATHFQAWGVGDSTFEHIKPVADNWADSITRQYLWPQLRSWNDANGNLFNETQIRSLRVMADGAHVTTRPNEAEDRRNLHDRITISDKTLRSGSGVGEDEKPTEEEFVQQFGRKINNPYLATFNMKIADDIDWEMVEKVRSGPGTPGAGGTPPSRQPADNGNPAGAPGDNRH